MSSLLDSLPPHKDCRISRRRFVGAGFAGVLSMGCGGTTSGRSMSGTSRLTARPHAPAGSLGPGTHDLASAIGAECSLFVPESYRAEAKAGLFVALHGAGQSRNYMDQFFAPASERDLLVLVPKSANQTWDLILGSFGRDVQIIDRALAHTFDHCNIDASRVALGGFSDGGSYALSLGLDNGDLFTHLIAFSAGFVAPQERTGKPGIHMFHGTADTILPIQSTSRRIADQLRGWAYDVTYHEFDGTHTVRPEDVRASFAWMGG